MADTKLTALTRNSAPRGGDYGYMVDDPAGTPLSQYLQLYDLCQVGPLNYKLSVTVSSNDLIVALKTLAGNDPSATDPLVFKINNTWRAVTAATSITIADGTNWFASGGPMFGGKLVGYFPYVVWDSNSSIVALTISRIPWGKLVSDFSATTTNEKHCYNYANFTTTDDVENIGYFEATLSLVATSYLWTIPAFTSANLRNMPTFETSRLSWTPQFTGLDVTSGTLTASYILSRSGVCKWTMNFTFGASSAISAAVTVSTPFTMAVSNNPGNNNVILLDSSAGTYYFGVLFISSSTVNEIVVRNVAGTYEVLSVLSSTVPFTWAVNDQVRITEAEFFVL